MVAVVQYIIMQINFQSFFAEFSIPKPKKLLKETMDKGRITVMRDKLIEITLLWLIDM